MSSLCTAPLSLSLLFHCLFVRLLSKSVLFGRKSVYFTIFIFDNSLWIYSNSLNVCYPPRHNEYTFFTLLSLRSL